MPAFPRSPFRLAGIGVLLTSLAVAGRAADDKPQPVAPLRVHVIAGGEYSPVESLTEFKKHLEAGYRVECTTSFSPGSGTPTKLDNLDALATADVLLIFARRMALREEQMKLIRAHWEAGKPVVGIRTASHAFQKADNEIFDRQVLGGNYVGGEAPYISGAHAVLPADRAADHPVLKGVGPFKSHRYSYGQGKMAASATVVLVGESKKDGKLPVAWVNEYKGGRTFYTCAGAPEDFKDDSFRRLLVNAIAWTARRDLEKLKK